MINTDVHVCTEGNVNLLMQYLPVDVSVLVTPCHMSVLLLEEASLSGQDQFLIIVTARR